MLTQNDHVKLAVEAKQMERVQLSDEIEELEKELTIKRTRLSWIDGFIEKGNLLLGIEIKPTEPYRQATTDVSAPAESEGVPPIEKSHVRGIEEILREYRRPMKASEIAKRFYELNWKLSKDNGSQIIRNVLKNNPDLFERLEDGRFNLR